MMPYAAPTICSRCRQRTSDCQCPPRKAFANKRHSGELNKLYSSARWQKAREQRLRIDKHMCQYHAQRGEIAPATEVDHVIAAAKLLATNRMFLFFDADNLRSTCSDCHKAKTARERLH